MNTLQAVQNLLTKEFGLVPKQVHAEAKLEEIGIDSLATIEFMFLLEERFKLKMSEVPATGRTIGDIAMEIDCVTVQDKVWRFRTWPLIKT
jgi:acyl carrier protein